MKTLPKISKNVNHKHQNLFHLHIQFNPFNATHLHCVLLAASRVSSLLAEKPFVVVVCFCCFF
ncbi:Protein of unknown function [Gryllus bimaculatus]|nr:Protein of unknown function [Gryllus bimaculatus]